MKRIIFGVSFSLCLLNIGSAQEKSNTNLPDIDKIEFKPTRYFISSYGSGNSIYRDFATSPLFYRGPLFSVQMAWQSNRLKSMRQWTFLTNFSPTSVQLADDQSYKTKAGGVFSSSSIGYNYMRPLSQLTRGKFSFAAGGMWLNTFNFRLNQALGNNAVGIEFFSNIMASGSVKYDVSHDKSGRRYILKYLYYTRKPRNQHFSLQFNAGLLNWNYRPGYAYKELPELDGSKTNPLTLVLSGFDWKLNGYRFGSELSFTRFKQNGNAVKWSYCWDVLHAPGRFEPFQMAMHRFQLSLLFNRN
jgi:hypothetical protein